MTCRSIAAAWMLGASLAATAAAQPLLDVREELDFDRPEAWAMKWVASINLATGFGAAESLGPGRVEVGFEGSWVPTLSDAEATVGFNGTKREEINRTSVFGRPRIRIGLPAGWNVELSWLPPLGEIDGIEPDLLSLAVERPLVARQGWRLGGRLVGQAGSLEGDITCSEGDVAGGSDPVLNPFLCESPSRDVLTVRSAGLELAAAWPIGRQGRWEPYAAVGTSYLDLEFQVDARYSGIIDRTNERASGWVGYGAVGVRYRVTERLRWAAEAFYAPLDVVRPPRRAAQNDELFHLRALVAYAVRR